MRCPDGCEPDVHKKAMLPCWNADPTRRPGFGALMEILVDLGAVPPHATSRTRTARGASQKRANNILSRTTTAAKKKTLTKGEVRQLLGPSVHHISTMLAPSVIKAVQPPWKDKRGNKVEPPESATVSHAVQAVIEPQGANKVSPRDGAKGAAYVDTLSSKDDVGTATALLSCEFFFVFSRVFSLH